MSTARAFLDALSESGCFATEAIDGETSRAVRRRFRDREDVSASFTVFAIGLQMGAPGLELVMTFDSDLSLFDVTDHPPIERW